jgi:hypothetical protein
MVRHTVCAVALLSGCTATLPEVVRVPVPVPCVKETPERPETRPEAEILAMPDYEATLTVWVERLALKAYSERAAALLEACR